MTVLRKTWQAAAWFAGALVALGGVWAIESWRNGSGPRNVCEQFATMVTTDHCHEAYRLTVASTYGFSTEEAFCREHSSTDVSASATCGVDEQRGSFFFLSGSVRRTGADGEDQRLPFGMTLRGVNGVWLVQSFTFDL